MKRTEREPRPGEEAVTPTRRPPLDWGRPQPGWVMLRPPVESLIHLFFRVRTLGLEHVPRDGPCLMVANHTDHLDPIVLLVALLEGRQRRTRFLALNELFELPLTGWWLRRARCIPVARGRGVKPMIDSAHQALEAGELVVVYPEGRLPRQPGVRLTARQGVGALARSLPAHVPIVPVAIRGLEPLDARQLHPARRVLERGLRHPVGVVAGSPLRSSELTGDDRGVAAALLGLIRARLEPLADRLAERR